MDRSASLMLLRPAIEISMHGEKNAEEQFMHQTLRPVLKFQHGFIGQLLKAEPHLDLNLLAGQNKTESEKRGYLNTFIQKNAGLKNTLVGAVIGLFGQEEMAYYLKTRKALNKRIIEMTVTRFLSEMA